MSQPTCTGDCTDHNRLCERDANHPDIHECQQCPGHLRRQRQQMIADRVAAHRAAELVETTPDVD